MVLLGVFRAKTQPFCAHESTRSPGQERSFIAKKGVLLTEAEEGKRAGSGESKTAKPPQGILMAALGRVTRAQDSGEASHAFAGGDQPYSPVGRGRKRDT